MASLAALISIGFRLNVAAEFEFARTKELILDLSLIDPLPDLGRHPEVLREEEIVVRAGAVYASDVPHLVLVHISYTVVKLGGVLCRGKNGGTYLAA